MKPGPAGVPDTEIIALLREGYSDRYIARTLHADPKRASQLRAKFDLPPARRSVLTLEQAWTARTRPADDGHLLWAGAVVHGTPVIRHRGRMHTARRIAFRIEHGREPVGLVRPGCGRDDCVAPAHVEDQPMRDQYNAIFGAAS
jgi:hypothetical protein